MHLQLSQHRCNRAVVVLLTCVDHQLSLAGVGTSQVLGSAGVHTGVFGASIENDQRIFRVIVDEGEVAALL